MHAAKWAAERGKRAKEILFKNNSPIYTKIFGIKQSDKIELQKAILKKVCLSPQNAFFLFKKLNFYRTKK